MKSKPVKTSLVHRVLQVNEKKKNPIFFSFFEKQLVFFQPSLQACRSYLPRSFFSFFKKYFRKKSILILKPLNFITCFFIIIIIRQHPSKILLTHLLFCEKVEIEICVKVLYMHIFLFRYLCECRTNIAEFYLQRKIHFLVFIHFFCEILSKNGLVLNFTFLMKF